MKVCHIDATALTKSASKMIKIANRKGKVKHSDLRHGRIH